MSVPPPPLVCSTPPPPEQCDDEAEDDEIGFHYKDTSFSPGHVSAERFTPDVFTEFRYPTPERCSPVEIASLPNDDIPSKPDAVYKIEDDPANDPASHGSEEENNIEDLDLKLDSLQIDFQNEKESAEDNLNDSFDDFGTFLGTEILNDLSRDSLYLKKIDTPNASKLSDESSTDAASSVPKLPVDPKDDCLFNESLTADPNVCNGESFELPKDVSDFVTGNLDPTGTDIDSNDITWGTSIVSNKSNTDDVDITTENDNTDNLAEKCEKPIDEFDQCAVPSVVYAERPPLPDNTVAFSNLQDSLDYPSDDLLNSELDIDKNLNDDFDDFTTFQSNEIKEILDPSLDANAPVDGLVINEQETYFEAFSDTAALPNFNNEGIPLDNEDDFGEFDTYNPENATVETCNFEASFDSKNVHGESSSNETDVIEKLCSAIGNIFIEDELNDEDKHKQLELKMILGESWTHLVNYDAQQSYLFPWNNSASQKSMLKCLGIDSRNILFGPKWNTNMPRFAANLGVSPLQPIRQSSQNSDPILEPKPIVGEAQGVNSNRESDWDGSEEYYGGDFQTSSYAESLLLDLEHLMATLDQMTSGQSVHFKISDLFTNACNERDDPTNAIGNFKMESPGNIDKPSHPSILNIGRKINLPDTHIFTPTDSETPWSHTIHYNDENLNDISTKNEVQNVYTKPCVVSNTLNLEKNIDDFDEFQSFDNHRNEKYINVDKTFKQHDISSDIPNNSMVHNNFYSMEPITNTILVNSEEQIDDFGDFQSAKVEMPNILSQTNVLEPVRVTPAVPIVNWPSPGDVYTPTFEDMNAEISKPPTTEPTLEVMSVKLSPFILKESKITNDVVETVNETTIHNDKGLNVYNPSLNLQENSSNIPSYSIHPSINFNATNSDDFSEFKSADHAYPSHQMNSFECPSINETAFVGNAPFSYSSDIGKTLLQPIPALVRNDTPKPATQQILQPLSLENYSQINWPDPGIDLQDLTRFNPVNSIKSYSEAKDSPTKISVANKDRTNPDDDGWSDFVSIKLPNSQLTNNKPVIPNMLSCNGYNPNKTTTSAAFDDNDDWSDFVSITPRNINELKTISQNIHSQNSHKNVPSNKTVGQSTALPNVNVLPNLSYVSTKSNVNKNYNGHFQNL